MMSNFYSLWGHRKKEEKRNDLAIFLLEKLENRFSLRMNQCGTKVSIFCGILLSNSLPVSFLLFRCWFFSCLVFSNKRIK